MTAVCEYIWSAYSVIAQIIYARTAQMTIMKHDVNDDWPAYQYGRDLNLWHWFHQCRYGVQEGNNEVLMTQ